ncbi:hypothetical protein WA026_007493 [Henosepilachna vigintioctopunctata]|uniref:PSP proline-rich domain-containing protein n=1 Tax=Henosepilachna vigintioctopunctata TaxID=420089 RepID=A0AAW1UQ27_9CUCU
MGQDLITEGQQSLKRKSEDFIYELSENDLSVDESVEDMSTKMRKIDNDAEVEVSNQMKSMKKFSTKEIEFLRNWPCKYLLVIQFIKHQTKESSNPSLNDSNAELRYSNEFSIEDKKPEEESSQKKCVSAQTCFNGGEDENQKYRHLKPGIISENLRNALGLKKNEVPSYIYRMRVFGYPPGWLKQAKIAPSSLSMYIDGRKVKINNKEKKKGLDPDKIIEYPGFNAPMAKGFHDDFRKYKVYPYSEKLEKHHMLKHFENMCEENDSETSDMELDDSQEMTNREAGEFMEEQSSFPYDSSLVGLENHRKNIINQLNTSNNETKSDDDDSQNNDSNSCEYGGGEENEPINTIISINSIKESTLGTPIIETGSPYMCLPNPVNFSIGISPVIDFENLPNSTGKYKKITGVLSKVRSTMKNLKTCKS